MVKVQGPNYDPDRLDRVLEEACRKHGFRLDVEGWTRKTYDVYAGDARDRQSVLIARIESFATVNGEIRVYDDRAMPLAQEVGEVLEREFGVKEAVILREQRPE
ncbi:MAG TPA: hypothetical protein VK081_03680 [Planctomycetota bacterium]|nr:hypothetical protein [Planctomycetota bacterium]